MMIYDKSLLYFSSTSSPGMTNTSLWQVVNKPLTTCQQAVNKQCEHILLTSC